MTTAGVLAIAALALAIGGAVGRWWARSRGRTEALADAAAAERVADDRIATVAGERDRMDLVLSSMREGVVLFDRDGAVAYRNAASLAHLGTVPAAMDALRPLGFLAIVQETARGGRPAAVDAEVGSPARWLRGSALAVTDDAVLLVIRDVTEARRLDQVRRDFVANASHELKTPAASIQAAAETIRTAAVDDPDVIPRFAGQLEREAVRLSRIVSDLLDLSRLESGSDLEDDLALDAIVRDEQERFDERASEAGVALEVEASSVRRVRGSRRDLALLVRNLVDNAIRYTPSGGEVRVTLADAADEVRLTVADTGIGIPKRDLPRIFERFYRVDRARSRETGGTGLGLAIVRHIVENHGGRVDVESELGAGTRFDVRLPTQPVSG